MRLTHNVWHPVDLCSWVGMVKGSLVNNLSIVFVKLDNLNLGRGSETKGVHMLHGTVYAVKS